MGYKEVQKVRRKYIGWDFSSATGVTMHRMARPGLLFQINAVPCFRGIRVPVSSTPVGGAGVSWADLFGYPGA